MRYIKELSDPNVSWYSAIRESLGFKEFAQHSGGERSEVSEINVIFHPRRSCGGGRTLRGKTLTSQPKLSARLGPRTTVISRRVDVFSWLISECVSRPKICEDALKITKRTELFQTFCLFSFLLSFST